MTVGKKTLKPFGKRVVIRRNKADEFFPGVDGKPSAIRKPDTAKKKEPTGTIIAVGPGLPGKEDEMFAKKGMQVVFNDYGYAPHPDMPDVCCVSQDDIIAEIIDEDEVKPAAEKP
jgi:co-chaperonin GroES (HSP10)